MFPIMRALTRRVSRTALLALAWTHRHDLLRWGRSFWSELRRPGQPAVDRLKTLARALWTIQGDDAIGKAKHLREVRLDGDVLVIDAAPGWRTSPLLVSRLRDLDGVRTIVDAEGNEFPAVLDVA